MDDITEKQSDLLKAVRQISKRLDGLDAPATVSDLAKLNAANSAIYVALTQLLILSQMPEKRDVDLFADAMHLLNETTQELYLSLVEKAPSDV